MLNIIKSCITFLTKKVVSLKPIIKKYKSKCINLDNYYVIIIYWKNVKF